MLLAVKSNLSRCCGLIFVDNPNPRVSERSVGLSIFVHLDSCIFGGLARSKRPKYCKNIQLCIQFDASHSCFLPKPGDLEKKDALNQKLAITPFSPKKQPVTKNYTCTVYCSDSRLQVGWLSSFAAGRISMTATSQPDLLALERLQLQKYYKRKKM